jgi:hypothetical protein
MITQLKASSLDKLTFSGGNFNSKNYKKSYRTSLFSFLRHLTSIKIFEIICYYVVLHETSFTPFPTSFEDLLDLPSFLNNWTINGILSFYKNSNTSIE